MLPCHPARWGSACSSSCPGPKGRSHVVRVAVVHSVQSLTASACLPSQGPAQLNEGPHVSPPGGVAQPLGYQVKLQRSRVGFIPLGAMDALRCLREATIRKELHTCASPPASPTRPSSPRAPWGWLTVSGRHARPHTDATAPDSGTDSMPCGDALELPRTGSPADLDQTCGERLPRAPGGRARRKRSMLFAIGLCVVCIPHSMSQREMHRDGKP
jgi:hypothetical protein